MSRTRTSVLLVEDDPADARLVVEALREVPGIDLRRAGSLHEARPIVTSGVDCVLLDLALPDSHGLDSLTAIAAADPATTIVVISGLDDPAIGEEAIEAGAADYVVKGSMGPERLALVVRMAMRRRKASDAREHRARILEMIVNRSALPDTLRAVAKAVESYADVAIRCAVLLKSADDQLQVVPGTGPPELEAALAHLQSFWAAACCRFAPCRGTPPHTCHMQQYAPAELATAAARIGLHACGSVPFTGRRREALGALLLMTPESVAADRDDLKFGIAVAGLAALAVERDREQARSAYESVHDPLTDLGNRSLLTEQLRTALARHRRDKRPVATVFLDLDDFKAINDRLGHAIGDQVLAEVARRIRRCVRLSDAVARYGGDEFAVVVEGLDGARLDALVARLRAAVAASPVSTTRGGVTVTVSAGAAVAANPDVAPAELIDLADRDMYLHRAAAARG